MGATEEEALADLFGWLEEWRALTTAESEAITRSDWEFLQQTQSKKGLLQEKIASSERMLFQGDSLSEQRKPAEKARLKEMTVRLLELEEENRRSLASLMELADQQLKASDKTVRSLRGVQSAYGTQHPSFWQAYS
jgi:hypothetical protein